MTPPSRSDVVNEDWIKTRTWDIWLGNTLVKTMAQLRHYCYRQGMTLDHFMTLPAAAAMPSELKAEMALWRQERLAQQMAEKGEVAEEELAEWEALRDEVEEKGIIRRVRSHEGAQRFDQPVGSVIKPDVVPNKPQTTVASSSSPTLHAGHYGTMSLEEYVAGLDEGKFPSWTAAYKAAWISNEGKVDPVADHDSLPGGRASAFEEGRVRVAITGHGTENPTVNFQIKGKAGQRQQAIMAELMEKVGAKRSVVAVYGNDRGDDEPVNGEFTFISVAQLKAFLTDPTKRPQVNERASFLAQFKAELGFEVRWGTGEDGVQVKEDQDALEGLGFWEALDYHLDTEPAFPEDLDEKGILRRVRTREGSRRYGQSIGTIIKPKLVPNKPETVFVPFRGHRPRASTQPKPRPEPRRLTDKERLAARTPLPASATPPPRTRAEGVVGALEEALGIGDIERNIRVAPSGKPNELYRKREARLQSDPEYAARFEKELAGITRKLPEPYNSMDPTNANPRYRAYVEDLSRRLAHAMVEPGPMHFDAESEQVTMEGRAIVDRLVGEEIRAAERRGVPHDRIMIAAAGVSGAGKTTSLKALSGAGKVREGEEPKPKLLDIDWTKDEKGNTIPKNYVVPNPDDFKEKMRGDLPPEYGELGINPDETALLTHELSSETNKVLLAELEREGYNTILDATYEGPMSKRLAEIQRFREAGFDVKGMLVDGEIGTSLDRAAGRHIVIERRMEEAGEGVPKSFGELEAAGGLGGEGGIDQFPTPDGGYEGRFVPAGLIGDQLPDDRPVIDAEGWAWVLAEMRRLMAEQPDKYRSFKSFTKQEVNALMQQAPGRKIESARWAPDAPWKSANAMNFENSIEAGLFSSWMVIDSQQNLVASGGGGGVVALGKVWEELAELMEHKAAKDKVKGSRPSRARYWLEGPAGTMPVLEAIIEYDEGGRSWEELAAFVSRFQFQAARTTGDMMWAETEDAFPQPKTWDEIAAGFYAGAITREQAARLMK